MMERKERWKGRKVNYRSMESQEVYENVILSFVLKINTTYEKLSRISYSVNC